MVALYLSISLTHNKLSRRKSIGVTLISSTPKYMGTVRKPVIPMSWKHGSQLTITSESRSTLAPTNIASAFATTLRGDVNCLGGAGRPGRQLHQGEVVVVGLDGRTAADFSSSSVITTRIPRSAISGAAGRKALDDDGLGVDRVEYRGVSSAQRRRSVRGVGWCSMVTLAPRIQMPCAVGAMSTGAPARTATASPWPTPAAARPPAIRRVRACTWSPGMSDGGIGFPGVHPLLFLLGVFGTWFG